MSINSSNSFHFYFKATWLPYKDKHIPIDRKVWLNAEKIWIYCNLEGIVFMENVKAAVAIGRFKAYLICSRFSPRRIWEQIKRGQPANLENWNKRCLDMHSFFLFLFFVSRRFLLRSQWIWRKRDLVKFELLQGRHIPCSLVISLLQLASYCEAIEPKRTTNIFSHQLARVTAIYSWGPWG